MGRWYKIGAYAVVIAAAAAFALNCGKIMGKILAGVVLLLAMIGSFLDPVEKTVPLSAVSSAIGLDISSGTVRENMDTHGGFLGDGKAFVKIQFPDGTIEEQILADLHWKPLPMTENLLRILYGSSDGSTVYLPLLQDENGEPMIGEVARGYYFFLDRHSKSTDSTDDEPLFTRSSFNFTLAVYDSDTGTISYFELDS